MFKIQPKPKREFKFEYECVIYSVPVFTQLPVKFMEELAANSDNNQKLAAFVVAYFNKLTGGALDALTLEDATELLKAWQEYDNDADPNS